MDQYLSTVIIAIITGVFSVITVFIQKKQDKVIDKIDKQTAFIEKEKTLKQARAKKMEERETVIHAIMILILDTNLYIFKNTNAEGKKLMDEIFKKSETLENKFNSINDELNSIDKEYDMLIKLASEFNEPIDALACSDKSK